MLVHFHNFLFIKNNVLFPDILHGNKVSMNTSGNIAHDSYPF